VNFPLARRYERYATCLGVAFLSRHSQQHLDASASTDQGNVSYEVPAIQAVYKIEVPSGEANHTAGFAEVGNLCPVILIDKAAKSIQAHERTILSSKVLTYIAVDFFSDPKFRDDVRRHFVDFSRS
jgi:hypothetical protein